MWYFGTVEGEVSVCDISGPLLLWLSVYKHIMACAHAYVLGRPLIRLNCGEAIFQFAFWKFCRYALRVTLAVVKSCESLYTLLGIDLGNLFSSIHYLLCSYARCCKWHIFTTYMQAHNFTLSVIFSAVLILFNSIIVNMKYDLGICSSGLLIGIKLL